MKLSRPLDANLANCIVCGAYPMVCDSLKSLLNANPKVGHVYTTSDVEEAKYLLHVGKVHLLVLDVDPPILNGLSFFLQVQASGYDKNILLVSSGDQDVSARKAKAKAKALGAVGYISKKETISVVSRSLDIVLNGEPYFKEGTDEFDDEITPKLSKRETTVLKHLMSGKTNKDISNLMSLSPKTISTYKTRILRKYDASSIIEIMKMKAVH
ncbi:hypothetical protein AKJ18_03640 [Vibrio xuii]|nr:hypothetical protein AKJ18_03640 [Vibrio xuii]